MHVTVVCLCTVGVVCMSKCVCVFGLTSTSWRCLVASSPKSSSTVRRESLMAAVCFKCKKGIIWTSSWVIFVSIVINNDKDESLVDFRGALPSPGIDEHPGGYNSDADHLIHRHAPTMPVCLTGHAPLLLQPTVEKGGGRQGGGWWSPRLHLIIRPIYTWQQTVWQTEYRTAATRTVLTENATRLRFII